MPRFAVVAGAPILFAFVRLAATAKKQTCPRNWPLPKWVTPIRTYLQGYAFFLWGRWQPVRDRFWGTNSHPHAWTWDDSRVLLTLQSSLYNQTEVTSLPSSFPYPTLPGSFPYRFPLRACSHKPVVQVTPSHYLLQEIPISGKNALCLHNTWNYILDLGKICNCSKP